VGRGLSDLQKMILVSANRRRTGPDRVKEHAMAQQHGGMFGADLKTLDIVDMVSPLRSNAQRAAISRACRRLEDRGLVIRVGGRYWAGINLTDKGIELAEQLGIDTLAYQRNISRRRVYRLRSGHQGRHINR
jgi:hypothetical protein